MKLLLDTHIALWATLQSRSLPGKSRSLIEDADNDIAVSVATIWEIAIKHALARGRPDDIEIPGRTAAEIFIAAGYTILPVTALHAAAIDDLPPLHRDPFDRMLVAQARSEGMHLITHDALLADYPVSAIVV